MGLFDYVRCEMPMPDGSSGKRELQTKDTPAQYLERYRIDEAGRLHGPDADGFTGEIEFYDLECLYRASFVNGVCAGISGPELY